jgi:D-threo-aldose 1-dehydrogenase
MLSDRGGMFHCYLQQDDAAHAGRECVPPITDLPDRHAIIHSPQLRLISFFRVKRTTLSSFTPGPSASKSNLYNWVCKSSRATEIMRQDRNIDHMLPGTELRLSRFAFGTASLHHLTSARSRRMLLEAAVEHGLTHFDTAPIYGFGSAERDLAPVLAAEPKLTVATKVGLYPPGGGEQTGAVVFARKVLGKLYPPLSRVHVDLSVKTAEVSLDASLKRLQRERLDILFIHEPDCTRIETEEWHRWLERERERGRLIAFGIAGAMAQIEPLVSSPLAQVIQTTDSISGHEADRVLDANRQLQITYGYLSAARRSGEAFEPRQLLIDALRRNRTGTILVSTRRRARLAECSAALDAVAVGAKAE